eukprot:5737376-Amphidinium_carterae.1
MDTCGRGDKSVQYIRTKGFRAFVERKKVGNTRVKVADCMSTELIELLEGWLAQRNGACVQPLTPNPSHQGVGQGGKFPHVQDYLTSIPRVASRWANQCTRPQRTEKVESPFGMSHGCRSKLSSRPLGV